MQHTLCANLCETASPFASAWDLEDLLVQTCWESGFPHIERLYAGSYFCENYFCALSDAFHRSMRELAVEHDLHATLVVPIIGQAFLERAERRLFDVLDRFGDVYDEVVVNDVAEYAYLSRETDKRLGLGRLFSKEQRDARYPDIAGRTCRPALSAEALACLSAPGPEGAPPAWRPLVEVDPVSAVLDLSGICEAAPGAEVALHLPFCLATTGRNCGPASIDEPDDEKFRLGRGCSQHCLRMAQGYRTDEGVDYVKHGRSYYYRNPDCRIAGADSWRVVYAVAHDTMR